MAFCKRAETESVKRECYRGGYYSWSRCWDSSTRNMLLAWKPFLSTNWIWIWIWIDRWLVQWRRCTMSMNEIQGGFYFFFVLYRTQTQSRRAVFGFSEAKPVSVAFGMRFFILYCYFILSCLWKRNLFLFISILFYLCEWSVKGKKWNEWTVVSVYLSWEESEM